MIIFDVDGNIWFKFRDVLKVLEYSDIKHTIIDMNIAINYKKQFSNIKVMSSTPPPSNFQRNTYFINESIFYLIFIFIDHNK